MASNVDPQVLNESQKRRREVFLIFPLALLFLFLTWVEFRLFGFSQSLPYEYSIFFFGLVNFNIIVFLLLFFLIFRNVVKIFSERQGRMLGRSLKGKLIAAFVTFSFVPTTLMFLVSVFYINNSFDKWFNEKVSGVLKSSLEVTDAYYKAAKKRNYHFASKIAHEIRTHNSGNVQRILEKQRQLYSLDAVEYYQGLWGKRYVALARGDAVPAVPPVSLEFLKRGVVNHAESSLTHHFEGGDLARVIVPVRDHGRDGAVVVSTFVPLSLISRMDDIASAAEEFRESNPLEYPLKSIYLIILVLMTLVILLGASWFGFYLAKQLSIPIEELGRATQRVAVGDYRTVNMQAGSVELNQLIANFNSMTGHLEKSELEVSEASQSLKATLAQLDEHNRYIEVVLSNVTTGVVSVDQAGTITMINRHAAKLLNLDSEAYVGRQARDVLNPDYYTIFEELISSMKKHRAETVAKEVRITVNGTEVPLQLTISVLYDEQKREVGKVLTFDDLSPVLRAQRAAAWTEVARRIAHEIKNPLTPIQLCAERLHKKFGQQINDPAFSQNIRMIIDQVDNLKGLVNEFSSFARLPRANPVLGKLNTVIEAALRLFQEAHRDCAFELETDDSLPDFKFDPDQMKRVVTNLLDNAVAAMQGREGQRVQVKTQYDGLLKIVRITVSDNGPGISAGMRERIFEPYVTTKEHGTGLGLAIVKRTVEDHSGFIRALPNLPRGTRILIELPVPDLASPQKIVKAAEPIEGATHGA